jgi:hypothetical protein
MDYMQCMLLSLMMSHDSFMYLCFISDYKVPFVPSDKDYDVVFISEGVQVVIPCRGSVENLNVTLHTVRTDPLTLLSIWADIIRHTKVELTSQKCPPKMAH